ncbi:DUR3 Urea active transporter [Candida maltosa Xu316]
MSSEESIHLLSKGAGYGVLIGVGGVFAIGMILTTIFLQKYLHENANSTETFSVANRSVGTFLSASAVYSSWSWSTELILSSAVVYSYGIQAAYYFGAGLAVQIAVMAMIGIHAKKKIPTAHTSLEIVEARYGKKAHILYLVLALITNICSSSAMILATSGAISIIAGNLHIVASTMLIPFGVLLYTVVGGLKATFLTDFIHTTILLLVLCYLNTAVLTSEQVGGLSGLWEKLVDVAATKHIEGNYEGSIITGKSQGAVIFGLVLTCGNFGLTVMDSAFWQKTFSASPRATVPAYLLTAFFIFSNVWPLGTIAGGASHFLESDPSFPTYPRKMNDFEIASGFVLPYVLKATLGNGAVGALLLIIYLAVTSTLSAQMVSVSSILSFDIYKKYVNPQARNKSMINVAHIGCIVFSFGIAGFCVMLHYVGINMTWYTYFYPMLICPGVIPLLFTITWNRQTFLASVLSPIIGLAAGLAVWLSTAHHYYGAINITTLGGQLPALFGSLTALLLPGITSVIISFIKPEKFDWEVLQNLNLIIKDDEDTSSTDVPEVAKEKQEDIDVNVNDKVEQSSASIDLEQPPKQPDQLSPKELDFWIKVATGSAIFVLLVTWVIWPMSVYRNWIFSESYFKGYVTVSLIWVYATLIVIGFVPFYTGRHSVAINANNTETFSVANRSVGTFLTSSAVYSSWTWSTESIFVISQVYNYGIQAAYYYGAGLCIQISVLALVGIHAKKKIPTAHTSLEAVELRYGKSAHFLYLTLALITNIVSGSSMLVGTAAVISVIAGNLHIVASTMLIPFGVLLYTTVGGLKATFLTDFIHTTVLLIVLCYLTTGVLTSDQVGGLTGLWDKLVDVAATKHIDGNYEGSIITGKSQGAVFFGLVLTCGNFGLTVMDSSFWQKTFAASPRSTVPAYLLTAILILSNVWPVGSIIGGASHFLENNPSFPTYPRKMNEYEVAAGFVLPYALKATLGKGAVGALLLNIYLAITSTLSAQMVSVSSLVSFDVYKKYINPDAHNKAMMKVSHISCVIYSFFISGFSIMLYYVGVNMTWYAFFTPIVICPGVIPLILTVTSDRQTRLAAITAPIVGLCAGIAVWLSTAHHYYGEITIRSTGGILPALFGGLTSLLLPGVTSIVISLIKPEKFDWTVLQNADLIVKEEQQQEEDVTQNTPDIDDLVQIEGEKVGDTEVKVHSETASDNSVSEDLQSTSQVSSKELDFWIKIATGAVIFVLLVIWIIWPMSLYRDWIFTAAYFKGYVVVGLIWLYTTLILIGFVPLYTGRHSTAKVFRGFAGYGVLIGVGAAFAIGMILTTILLQKYLHENARSTETFSVANRSVGTFLTASAVYSSWSWATELILVSSVVYSYGIQAAYYYGAGLAVQISVMSMVGIHAKKKVPTAHTSLEIVEARYGKKAHILYLVLALITNICSSSAMILATSSAISIVAGNLHIVASTMLIPFGVLLYTVVGGLKATFLTDFVHTTILLVILCYLNTAVLTSEQVGGLDGLWEKLVKVAATKHIEGNYAGSILTGKSQGAVIFGLILTCGNFGLSVMDSAFWQKTFSASPRATVPAYLLTAILIMSNVWPLGAIIAGSSHFLESDPSFPTYPRKMNDFEIASGYVLPYVLKAILGNGGVGALLLVFYLAVTSTLSAQMVSVSSILSFDIYKKYIHPNATNKSMIRVSHIGCVFFGFGISGFSLMLYYVGINMTWYTYFYPLLICPGVIPLLLTITWNRQTFWAAFISPLVGMGAGLAVWLSTAKHYFGVINITTLGEQLPALFGSLTALLLPGVVSVIVSLVYPSKFDWKELQNINLLVKEDEKSDEEPLPTSDPKEKQEEVDVNVNENDNSEQSSESIDLEQPKQPDQLSPKELDFWIKVATTAAISILLITWVLWPMPLYRDWIFSEAYFKGYVTVGLIWLYSTLILIGLVPFYTGRHSMAKVFRGLYNDYIKKKN